MVNLTGYPGSSHSRGSKKMPDITSAIRVAIYLELRLTAKLGKSVRNFSICRRIMDCSVEYIVNDNMISICIGTGMYENVAVMTWVEYWLK